ncbi:hypothetical protein RU86_GL001538 [Lactococcus piscium]|uniref:Uncharacterized protein n=1 Tax=Pseudolactococcus piscium TaxID=1364 RepID=A0A2A5S4Y7_9LACT|nr:hypothetical protein RU86_GL001538 [Lactococcus piscium]
MFKLKVTSSQFVLGISDDQLVLRDTTKNEDVKVNGYTLFLLEIKAVTVILL